MLAGVEEVKVMFCEIKNVAFTEDKLAFLADIIVFVAVAFIELNLSFLRSNIGLVAVARYEDIEASRAEALTMLIEEFTEATNEDIDAILSLNWIGVLVATIVELAGNIVEIKELVVFISEAADAEILAKAAETDVMLIGGVAVATTEDKLAN